MTEATFVKEKIAINLAGRPSSAQPWRGVRAPRAVPLIERTMIRSLSGRGRLPSGKRSDRFFLERRGRVE